MRRGDPSVVLIGGWSWHRHVGDDAILRAHLSELGRELPRHDVLVVCGEPERLAERMEVRALWSAAPAISQLLGPGLVHEEIESAHLLPVVDEAVAVALAGRAAELPRFAALVDAISRADAVVAASAGSLTTYYPLTVAEQVVALRIAQVSGKPTAISGASLGPFGGKADAELLGPALAGADLVSVRDATVSPQRARALGVAEERLAIQPDPAFWMEGGADEEVEATIHRAGFEVGGEFGLLTVALWPGGNDQIAPLSAVIEAVAQATRISFLGVPMFVPPQPADDLALDAVRERLGRSRLLTRADPLPDDPVLLGLSKRAQVVVGSRFHGAVLAAAVGTPSVLVHDGPYQREKAESLAASTSAVRAVALADGPEAIAAAVIEHSATAHPPLRPEGPLPAIAWLEERLRRPRSRFGWLPRALGRTPRHVD